MNIKKYLMNNKNNKIRVNIIDLLIFSSVILPINLCTSDTNINSVLSKKPLSLRFKKSPSIYKPSGAQMFSWSISRKCVI